MTNKNIDPQTQIRLDRALLSAALNLNLLEVVRLLNIGASVNYTNSHRTALKNALKTNFTNNQFSSEITTDNIEQIREQVIDALMAKNPKFNSDLYLEAYDSNNIAAAEYFDKKYIRPVMQSHNAIIEKKHPTPKNRVIAASPIIFLAMLIYVYVIR